MLGKNTPGLCLDGSILMLNNGGWDGNSGVGVIMEDGMVIQEYEVRMEDGMAIQEFEVRD